MIDVAGHGYQLLVAAATAHTAKRCLAAESDVGVSKRSKRAVACGPPFANADVDYGVGRSLGTRAILSPPCQGVKTYACKESIKATDE